MYIDFLLDGFCGSQAKDAIVWRDQAYSYAWLLDAIQRWRKDLSEQVAPGSVVSLEADFSPNAVALLLAMVELGCIIVPLTTSVEGKKPEFRRVAEVEFSIRISPLDKVEIKKTTVIAKHELLLGLKNRQRPGLVLFSSGSTGENKAAVHDMVSLLEKFKVRRHTWRTISFLLFDHIGGVNTLLYTLANAGCVVTLQDRLPDAVCESIQKHKVQLLPTSPTFINLLLISEAYQRFDLSSLEMITYGTEVMPESTLRRFHELFPQIRLVQTYGLSEIGILRAKSRSSDSLWVKVGGEGYQTRVVNGLLEVKAQSAMLGYLNAANPYTPDGWFQTGDAVEVDGEYIRILGRRSEIINIGGEKAYPAEIESVIQMIAGVEEVVVSAERCAITGQLVKATVKLSTSESSADFIKRMWTFCQGKLPKFKIPQKVVIVNAEMHGGRFKKIRTEQNLREASLSKLLPESFSAQEAEKLHRGHGLQEAR